LYSEVRVQTFRAQTLTPFGSCIGKKNFPVFSSSTWHIFIAMYFFFAHHLHKIVANEQLRSQVREKIRQPSKLFSMYDRIDRC